MEALKAELERKRKQKQQEFGGRKFVKRSEIESARKVKIPAKGSTEEVEVAPTETGPQHAILDVPGAGRGGVDGSLATTHKKKGENDDSARKLDDDLEPLDTEEVIRRLRALGQPATLFAESNEDRQRRLVVAAKNITVDDKTPGQQANELHGKLRTLDAEAKRLAATRKKKEKEDGGTEETKAEDVLEKAFEQAAQDLAKKRAAENMTVGDRITVFFRHIMEQWQQEIDKMQDDYLLSMEGKMLRATYDLTSKNLKHMYRQLKNNSLPDDVKRGMWLIVEAMQRRDYREAMDVYLRVSIGNAPWPIGVTMVGIHERSAREKIHAQSQAHIMHDEASRKMLNGVKRCISFCQRRYPANPSRTVDFNLRVFGDDLQALHDAENSGQAVDAASKDFNIPKNKYGNSVDGWKAQDRDNRTLSAVLNSAYKNEDDVKKNYGERQIVMQ
mmetsp:Transcript_39184/g.75110  ORF Transcript_39184/g.75110 Transcript_39184/m.75110 type:complete len:444 (-) Transcript_39184:186-1517(-)|eukprot:CAMPEP_0114238048 /NCGR_PEP_ID=MMETSP0058-20121206/7718_1 /TAXON_ID=36894 /ORGANISM="Pyramimonas parkeae, CCMP726" /LENGTH=443 /DNA_ID=CAMNT_0001350135 /DNA_START=144 /DNA_END=1475 /DNA_ORIENTATION=+